MVVPTTLPQPWPFHHLPTTSIYLCPSLAAFPTTYPLWCLSQDVLEFPPCALPIYLPALCTFSPHVFPIPFSSPPLPLPHLTGQFYSQDLAPCMPSSLLCIMLCIVTPVPLTHLPHPLQPYAYLFPRLFLILLPPLHTLACPHPTYLTVAPFVVCPTRRRDACNMPMPSLDIRPVPTCHAVCHYLPPLPHGGEEVHLV